MGLLDPNPDVNYGFLAGVYAIFTLIAALLFGLQHFQVTDSVTGFWLVPAPALPAFFYALLLKSKAGKMQPAAEPSTLAKKRN